MREGLWSDLFSWLRCNAPWDAMFHCCSTKTKTFTCAWCTVGPTKPCSAQMVSYRDTSSVLYQIFDVSASAMQGTDAVLVLVAGSDSPWVIDSGLGVSKMTPPCPGATVFWAQHKWMILRSDLHLMFYVTSEPLWSWRLPLCSSFLDSGLSCSYLSSSWASAETFTFPFPKRVPPSQCLGTAACCRLKS